MNIGSINNTNTTFCKLKKITCSTEDIIKNCCATERRIKIELKTLAENNNFFKNNNVNAYIAVTKNTATLNLSYKPIARNFADMIKNIFVNKKKLTLVEYEKDPNEGMINLIRKMRRAKNSEDLLNLATK